MYLVPTEDRGGHWVPYNWNSGSVLSHHMGPPEEVGFPKLPRLFSGLQSSAF